MRRGACPVLSGTLTLTLTLTFTLTFTFTSASEPYQSSSTKV